MITTCEHCGAALDVAERSLMARCACGLMSRTPRHPSHPGDVLELARPLPPAVGSSSTHTPKGSPLMLSSVAHHLLASLTPKEQKFALAFGADFNAAGMPRPEAMRLSATTISGNADLEPARVGFQAAFMQAMAGATDPAEALALTMPSTGRAEQVKFMGDAPAFAPWVGERTMSGIDAFSLAELVNLDFASGLRIKANDWKDDNLGLLPAAVVDLANRARRHRAGMIVQALIDGFTRLSYDGVAYFATTHATGSNKLTVALDAAGLAAASLLIQSQTTFTGDPLELMGTHIICGPKLEPTARKLVTQEYLSGGESNADRGRYQVIVTPRLAGASDDYWFLADLAQAFKPLRFQLREEITTTAIMAADSPAAFSRNEYQFGAQARYNVGYLDHRLIVGSQVA